VNVLSGKYLVDLISRQFEIACCSYYEGTKPFAFAFASCVPFPCLNIVADSNHCMATAQGEWGNSSNPTNLQNF